MPQSEEMPDFIKQLSFYNMDELSDDSNDPDGWVETRDEFRVNNPKDANLVGSRHKHEIGFSGKPKHKLLLDLNVNHWYVPSSTPGHGHLYVDVDLYESQLRVLIAMLAEFGIVGQGIVHQLNGRGELTLRLPGNVKTNVSGWDDTEPDF